MKCYIVDAFAEKVFEGNPAGVCVLDKWISDELMQNIAIENNLSETAFTVKTDQGYHLRWFTPGGEIDLCGHATLATAFVLSNFYDKHTVEFHFITLSGELIVVKNNDVYEMNFPSIKIEKYPLTEKMINALGGVTPVEAYMGRDLVFVLESEEQVKELTPDFTKIKSLDEGLAVFVTAASEKFDFVARSFWPKLGINEDPVCGSMFCSLIPYWSQKLNKSTMVARQVSKRGGTVHCVNNDDRVQISGTAALYSISDLQTNGYVK